MNADSLTATKIIFGDANRPTLVRRPMKSFRTITWLICIIACGFILYPIIRLIVRVVGITDTGWQFPLVLDAIVQSSTLIALRNASIAVAGGGAIALVIGTLFAWLNARTNARVGFFAEVLPLTSLFVPALAGTIGWLFLAAPVAGLLNYWIRGALSLFGINLQSGPLNISTWPGMIFLYGLYLTSYVYLAVTSGLQSLDSSLEEAARMSGAGPLQILRRITLPNLKPAIGAAILQIITIGFALFSIPVIIGTTANIKVLPVEIVYSITRQVPPNLPKALGMSLILIAIVVIVTLVQRRSIQAVTFARIGGRGIRANVFTLGPWKYPARILMLGYLIATSVLPFFALLIVSFQGFWTPKINWSRLNLANYTRIWNQDLARQSVTNSLLLALIAATAAVFICALISYSISRNSSLWSRLVDVTMKIPATISHIIMGVAFLIAFAGPPFEWSGKLILVLTAYIVIYLPQASILSNAAVQQIGPEVTEAAKVSGAHSGEVFCRIILPLMMPSLLAAWALVFVLTVGDINVSALLAAPSRPVVGLMMLDIWDSASYPMVAAFGVVITMISSVVVVTVLAFSRRFYFRR